MNLGVVYLLSVITDTSYDGADKIPFSSPTNLADILAASDLRKDMLKLEGILADITFTCDGEEFPAHRNILGARSDVFSAMFQHNGTQEAGTNQVDIQDTDAKTVKKFLQ